jgi:hypothetical protein
MTMFFDWFTKTPLPDASSMANFLNVTVSRPAASMPFCASAFAKDRMVLDGRVRAVAGAEDRDLLLVGDLQRALEAVLAGRQGDGVAFLGGREDRVQVGVVHLGGRDDGALHHGGGRSRRAHRRARRHRRRKRPESMQQAMPRVGSD